MIPYLLLGAILFSVGIFLLFTRRNTIMALMGIELMLNAANINFVTFSQHQPQTNDGQMAALFVIVLAAAETAVALSIILQFYKQFKTVNISEVNNLKG
ncbi:MAG: NADH-quinone oxidoreductase subunit NuoK [Bacteroidia bacterium]